ncbi:hypothetical protein GCM10010495_66550 [Kitasatospora herbaricolor]|uniref:hypothetical protein n=1 Tax=Kitasatospora herbaricolor TaxID=68217 RepID=UPI00174DC716|nr:hypothetical protein [Kitasatospora herbaricolor]MDQ0313094.1 hypothetical protein [Kitasatospora herbaricolor]GGV39895.1 hypothetical protein GCM10010495_66550 [Kitasatospora herbaricolor]
MDLVEPETVPDRVGHLGNLVETFLPWRGTAVPVLLLCAPAGRSPRATVAHLPSIRFGVRG